jgi:hypothetical protein
MIMMIILVPWLCLFSPSKHLVPSRLTLSSSPTHSAMADDRILHYLPPGWTEDMYQNQTDAALEALSEQVRGHITRSKREENKIYPSS